MILFRNEQFQKFVNDCSKIATTTDGVLDSLLKSKIGVITCEDN